MTSIRSALLSLMIMEKHQAIGPKERLKHQVNGTMGLHCTCTYVQAIIRVVPELYLQEWDPSDQIPEWDPSIHFGASRAHCNTLFTLPAKSITVCSSSGSNKCNRYILSHLIFRTHKNNMLHIHR